MSTAIIISIVGALSAIIVALLGAWFSNRNSLILQHRALKEKHYVSYIEALHNLASDSDKKNMINYTFNRDRLFVMANEEVIKKMVSFEEFGVGEAPEVHDKYLTDLVKEIRKDLEINDKDFPNISLK